MSQQIERATKWMYRGIWGVLTEWFRVPDQPPTLPVLPGESLQSFKPSQDYLRYLMLFFWISWGSTSVFIFLAWFALTVAFPLVAIWFLPLVIIVVSVMGLVGYLSIHLQFDSTWYVLSQRSLRIRNGIWVINEATITFENIQNVTVESGPIERIFGIANVVVDTAGGGSSSKTAHGGESNANLHRGEIAGVSNATEIRQLILSRLATSKSSGLGDEHPSFANAWSTEHLAVLAEIRDALKV